MKRHAMLVGIGFTRLATLAVGASGCVNAEDLGNEGLGIVDEGQTAEAASALTVACTLGVNCPTGTVTNLSTNGSMATYRVNMRDMSTGTIYRRMDVFASVCNPTGNWLHIGDSPNNDGDGNDGGYTDHDAEVYMLGNHLYSYNAATPWEFAKGRPGAKTLVANVYPGGCKTVKVTVFDAFNRNIVQFFSDSANTFPSFENSSAYGFTTGYTTCASATSTERSTDCDWEDQGGWEQYYWYIGVNRMISGPYGAGVSSACIVLNTEHTANPASCL